MTNTNDESEGSSAAETREGSTPTLPPKPLAETGQASPSIPPLTAAPSPQKREADITSEAMSKTLPPEILAQIVFILIEHDFRQGNPEWLELFKNFRAVNRAWRAIANSAQNSLYRLVFDLSRLSARQTSAELALNVCYSRIQQLHPKAPPLLPEIVFMDADGYQEQIGQMFLPFTGSTLRIAISLFNLLQRTRIPPKDLANHWGEILVKAGKSQMPLKEVPALVGKICKQFPALDGRELISVVSRSVAQWESTTGKPELFDTLLTVAALIHQKHPLAKSDDMLTIGLYFLNQKITPKEFSDLMGVFELALKKGLDLKTIRIMTEHVMPTSMGKRMDAASRGIYIDVVCTIFSTNTKINAAELANSVKDALLSPATPTAQELVTQFTPKPTQPSAPSHWWSKSAS